MSNGVDLNSKVPKKSDYRNTNRAIFERSFYRRSEIRMILVLVLSIFLCETIVMLTLKPFDYISPWLISLLDASILIIVVAPFLYLFVIRPLIQNIKNREQAEKNLLESEMRFRTIFRTSPDSITISRLEDGRFVDVNDGFSAMTGYSREEVLEKSSLNLSIWSKTRDRQDMVAMLKKYGQVINFETKLVNKDGRFLDGLISARVIVLNDEPHILAVSRDISELKKTERTLRMSQNFLQISNKHRDMNLMIEEFVAQIKTLTNCSALGIRILDQNGNIPYLAKEGFSFEFYESENPLSIDANRCMCADVILGKLKFKQRLLTNGGSFYVGSTSRFLANLSEEEKNRFCDVCGKYGYESVVLIPIPLSDNIIGLIHLADTRKEYFSLDTLEILEGAAMQFGVGIERVRAEETLKKSYEELENRVADRTAELVSTNELLSTEIKERVLSEKKLQEYQEKLRSLTSELLLIEERERRRIATELHDHIGQTLAISMIKLGEVQQTLASKKTVMAVKEIRQYIEQTIQDTRSLTFELSPPVLYELGLEAALAWLGKEIQKKHGLRIVLKEEGQPMQLNNSCRVIAFQAVRELLFNIIKHAQAKNSMVSIRRDDSAVHIEIEDDGIGFDTSKLDNIASGFSGFGLFNIRERLLSLGGSLEINSELGRGTRVSLALPLVCHTKIKENSLP